MSSNINNSNRAVLYEWPRIASVPPHRVFEPVREEGDWITVRLTHHANLWLRVASRSSVQQQIWAFPHHEFEVRRGAVHVRQIMTQRPSYINAILIASRAPRTHNRQCQRGEDVYFRGSPCLPGWFNGCCANCKWPDGAARCRVRRKEPQWFPPNVVGLPGPAGVQLLSPRVIEIVPAVGGDTRGGSGRHSRGKRDLGGSLGRPIVLSDDEENVEKVRRAKRERRRQVWVEATT